MRAASCRYRTVNRKLTHNRGGDGRSVAQLLDESQQYLTKAEVCGALVEAGADVSAENKWGDMPADLAEEKGHSALVQTLHETQEPFAI